MKLLGQFLLIIAAHYLLYLILALLGLAPSNSTPPGAQGITSPFITLATATALLLLASSIYLHSLAPPIAASIWLAVDLAKLAYIDTRTFLHAPAPPSILPPLSLILTPSLILLAIIAMAIILGTCYKRLNPANK